MGNKPVVVAGEVYGQLTVLEEVGKDHRGKRIYRCRCSCGKTAEIKAIYLRNGDTKSCGCLYKACLDSMGARSKTHGHSYLKEYFVWKGMIRRCENPKDQRYADYGGRGIKVCARWHDLDAFLKDVGNRPSADYSFDRIDNNGDYEPNNCRWATKLVQGNNRRPFTVTANRLNSLLQKEKLLAQYVAMFGVISSAA